MSMLANPKFRKNYILLPKGKALYEDDNRFGSKMLTKMGWTKGKGLGANEDGSVDFVRQRYKNNADGLGFKDRDDHWTVHDETYNNVLKSLNANHTHENSNTNENENADVEMATVGFGFKKDEPKSTLIAKGKLSGESLEEKSMRSRVRVHYKKFTRAKDLSQYSEKDLANIFGKKSIEEPKAPADEEKNIKISTFSSSDYFKQKMEAMKKIKQLNGVNVTAQNDNKTECVMEENPAPNVLIQDKKLKRQASKEEHTDNDDCSNVVSKKKKKNSSDLFCNEENFELVQVVKKKKKKSKDKESDVQINEGQEFAVTNDSNTPTLSTLQDTTELVTKKNKSKKQKKLKDETTENSNEYIFDAIEVKQTARDDAAMPDVKQKKKKKQKKYKESENVVAQDQTFREFNEINKYSIENQQYCNDSMKGKEKSKSKSNDLIVDLNNEKTIENTKTKKNKLEHESKQVEEKLLLNLVQSNEKDGVADIVSKQKKKKKNTKVNENPLSSSVDIIERKSESYESNQQESSDSTRNVKKSKWKLKELIDDEVASESASTKKKRKREKVSSEKEAPTLEESEHSKGNDESDSDVSNTEVKNEDPKTHKELQKILNSYNVFKISKITAEKFALLNLDAFNGSTLPKITGYTLNENIKIKISINQRIENAYNRMLTDTTDKYRMYKQKYDKYQRYSKNQNSNTELVNDTNTVQEEGLTLPQSQTNQIQEDKQVAGEHGEPQQQNQPNVNTIQQTHQHINHSQPQKFNKNSNHANPSSKHQKSKNKFPKTRRFFKHKTRNIFTGL